MSTQRAGARATVLDWRARASLLRRTRAEGHPATDDPVEKGTLAEMVAWMMIYPADQRRQFYIRSEGKRITAANAERLSEREDFPLQKLMRTPWARGSG